jgi:hypothetical protein
MRLKEIDKIKPGLKYDKDLYTDCGFYDGDMEGKEIACYKERLVKCRKIHTCYSCQKEIANGEYAVCETGFMDGKSTTCYTCARCIEKWLETSGQVDQMLEGDEE